MAGDPLNNMKDRAEQFRRLASMTADEKMRWQLLDWAHEIEEDIQNLDAERHQRMD